MLDAVQTGAGRKHPAGENPLYLTLQRDLIDLDERIGVGGFCRRPRVASLRLDPQGTELNRLTHLSIELDDAAGDLVQTREHRLLVDDLLRWRLGHNLITRLQRGR